MLYSVLDLFRSPLESAELVQRAEALGFHRYWVGEHHGPAQCPNPLLLGSVLLGLTARIRIGTGALGLLFRSPWAIAEDVEIVRSLFGDRLDLGISRGFVGTNPNTRERTLLLDGRDTTLLREEYPERLRQLCALLSTEPSVPPPLWLVGSSLETAALAAALGVGLCTSFYHARSIADLGAALALYRETFKPSSTRAAPHSILVQSGVCAASAAAADAALRAYFLTADDALALTPKPMGPWLFGGTGAECRAALEAALARFQPDEIMIHNLLPQSLEMEVESLELLAAALRLPAVALAEAAMPG